MEYFDVMIKQKSPSLNSFSGPYIFVDCLDIWINYPSTLMASTLLCDDIAFCIRTLLVKMLFSQAGAPFGSCKNVAVPSGNPITNTAGSFTGSVTGSVQFAKSASTVNSPNHLVFFMFSFPLMAFWL